MGRAVRTGEKVEIIRIRDENIKLGQALKLSGAVESGVEAKMAVQGGRVKVNGQVETQRGKKLVSGDVIQFNGSQFRIEG